MPAARLSAPGPSQQVSVSGSTAEGNATAAAELGKAAKAELQEIGCFSSNTQLNTGPNRSAN